MSVSKNNAEVRVSHTEVSTGILICIVLILGIFKRVAIHHDMEGLYSVHQYNVVITQKER